MEPVLLQAPTDLDKRLDADAAFAQFVDHAAFPRKAAQWQSVLWKWCIGCAIFTAVILVTGAVRFFRGPLMVIPLFLVLAILAPFLLGFWRMLRTREEAGHCKRRFFEALRTGNFSARSEQDTVIFTQGDVVIAKISQTTAALLESDRKHTRQIEEELSSTGIDSREEFPQSVLPGEGGSAAGSADSSSFFLRDHSQETTG